MKPHLPPSRRSGLLAAAVAAAMMLGLVPAAEAAPDPFFGVNVQSVVNYLRPDAPVPATDTTRPITSVPDVSLSPSDRWSRLFGQAAADGIGTARVDAPWSWVEPNPPTSAGRHTYVWSTNAGTAQLPVYKNLDNVIGHLALSGIRANPVLDYAPTWAQVTLPGGASSPFAGNPYIPPASSFYPAFAAYAQALARRYGPLPAGGCNANSASFWCSSAWLATGKPAVPVTTYEVWNEENVAFNWAPAPDANAYVAMFNQVRDAIRSAQAGAQVIVGGIVWNDAASYIQNLFDGTPAFSNGGPDGVAIHPYGPTPFSVLANTHVAAAALAATGHPTMPIYQTELGWPRWDASMGTPPSLHAATPFTSDRDRAGTMALVTDALASSDCPIAGFSAYALAERENGANEVNYSGFANDPTNAEQWMGLYGRDTAAPTLESQAYAQAIAAHDNGSMAAYKAPVCGTADINAATAPSPPLLPLTVTAQATSATCLTAQVTYKGWPVEEAFVHAVPATGAAVTQPTDADGNTSICVGAASASIGVVANVPYAALSPLLTLPCSPTTAGCPAAAPPAPATTATKPAVQAPCALASAVVAPSSALRTKPTTLGLTVRLRGVAPVGCRVSLRLALAKTTKKGTLVAGIPLGKVNVVVTKATPPELTVKVPHRARGALKKAPAKVLTGLAIGTTANAGQTSTKVHKKVAIPAKPASKRKR